MTKTSLETHYYTWQSSMVQIQRIKGVSEELGASKFSRIKGVLEELGASGSFIGDSRPMNLMDLEQESNEVEKMMDVDTLVASLIATITFAAIFSVPGGINEHTGVARMTLNTLFQVFVFSDSLAMFASLTVVIAWYLGGRFKVKPFADHSLLASLSFLSLGTSIIATALAFLTATILVTIPPKPQQMENADHYKSVLAGEILTAFFAPALALIFLLILWAIEYNLRATVEVRTRLRKQLKETFIYTVPPLAILAIVLGIIIGHGLY